MAILPPSGRSATATVPAIYRILLLYLEPVFALGGVLLVLTQPQTYTSTMTRASVTSLDPATRFIYTELGGAWLHFAFTEAIALRLLDDVRAWKVLCMAMLMSDLLYCHSVAEAVGGWQAWLVVADWTVEDWIATVTTWPFVLTRFAILFDVGLREAKQKNG
ncbi:hypothetical protein EJ03DRAFT_350976 [Teratosphaeria nubilosa]|uniref:DUF7704 domain-containing protein n=1 Tax=Teratosphaeria nubilosa TaxID=161662 RepID=A0A6G1LAT7_9PEZI|nr:hypothetical protein EJ03DRAFT_350976 [Teratosphaeria nubilosa]